MYTEALVRFLNFHQLSETKHIPSSLACICLLILSVIISLDYKATKSIALIGRTHIEIVWRKLQSPKFPDTLLPPQGSQEVQE